MPRRYNKQTRAWERQQPDGSWQPISADDPQLAASAAGTASAAASIGIADLDQALSDTFGAADVQDADLPPPPQLQATGGATMEPHANGTGGPAVDAVVGGDGPADGLALGDAGAVVVDDIPGLTSADSARSVRGAQSVRDRLRSVGARSKTRREPKTVTVGPRSAKPQGPAVKDSTEARQTRGRAAVPETKGQRYVNRPAPEILSGRPKWVQDLFEAHFRSEEALGLRRTHNRMKISRLDYAIGWLVALDKIREEPSIARLKEARDGQG